MIPNINIILLFLSYIPIFVISIISGQIIDIVSNNDNIPSPYTGIMKTKNNEIKIENILIILYIFSIIYFSNILSTMAINI